jgi:serine protease Do
MKPIRKSLAVAVLSGGSVAALLGGSMLVRDVNVARADETPKQGNVQAPVEASPKEQEHLEGLASLFRKVGKSVEPAVVNIKVEKRIKTSRPPGYEDMLRRFFPDRDKDGEPDVPEGGFNDEGSEFRQVGTGSGVVVEVNGSDAYIVTNNHVADGATEIAVTLSDGRVVEGGKVIGTDPKSDLAVIKLKADGLIAVPWGDSDKLEKGDWIMAFGSPFGYVGSMTHGIVSALNRDTRRDTGVGILGPDAYENFIQVDAPINPGNSGGPLVNTRGEVVGINTAIASASGGFNGIGFAVPSNQAKFVYTSLKTHGKVVRGYIGVSIQDVSRRPELARSFGYESRDGVLIAQIGKKSPAADKLQPGDIVVALAGKPIKDSQDLRNTIASTAPGTDLKVTVFRNGKNQDVTLKIAEQPEDLMLAMNTGVSGDTAARTAEDGNADALLGMSLATATDKVAQDFGQGAVITDLDPKGPAAKAGLRKGDVILQVFNEPVQNAKQAIEAIRKADPSKGIRLYVSNAEGRHFELIKPKGS